MLCTQKINSKLLSNRTDGAIEGSIKMVVNFLTLGTWNNKIVSFISSF